MTEVLLLTELKPFASTWQEEVESFFYLVSDMTHYCGIRVPFPVKTKKMWFNDSIRFKTKSGRNTKEHKENL